MTITALPTPPSRSDPANFSVRADAFLVALPTFGTEANALADEVNGSAASASASATSAQTHANAAANSASTADDARVLAQAAANYVGVYAGGTQYTVGQCVSYNPGGGEQRYVAKSTTTGNLPTNTTYWLALPSSGTVTSVALSPGTTGLSVSGSPITSSGTFTLSGTLAVANGGSGQTTYTNGQLLIGNTTGNTLTKATLTQGTGITITNGAGSITIGVTASTYQPLDSTLTQLAAFNTNGLLTQIASDTFTARTITQGNGISVSNGNGVFGNPTIAVDAADNAAFQAATANKVITAGILNTANAPEETTGSTAWVPDFDSARTFTRVLSGSQAFNNPSNLRAGQSGLIFVTQTGTSAFTVTSWGSYYKWPATGGTAPALNTGQNKVNVVGYYVKSTTEIVANFLGSY